MIYTALTLFLSAFLVGILACWLLRRWVIRREIQEAKREAQDILEEAQSLANEINREAEGRMEEFNHEAHNRFDKEIRKTEERNEILQQKVSDKESQLQKKLNKTELILQSKIRTFDQQSSHLKNREAKYMALKKVSDQLSQDFRERLTQVSTVEKNTVIKELQTELIQNEQRRSAKIAEMIQSDAATDSEKLARYYLGLAINRFARPYCEERGIGLVYFPHRESRLKVMGPNRTYLNLIEKICGVDISINEEFNSASCLGFDPVRRELARSTLEKLIHEKTINEKRIDDVIQKTKKDLFKKIRQDGLRVAKELGMKDFHPEIINMLGALRYRYSFSQNQHFHCAEVGWLCGLLSSELNEAQDKGRRAGLLHDIGKSMDHSMEGGHAVIGADFIQKHGEQQDIVHAVRAHHYDEQPQTHLAYLVIAADAVSGARPGARRSTVDSYNQKMADLQKIGNSFSGVTNTYILSAGREVRVLVDSQQIDDVKALELSKKIANKIEEECSYPGQIRITVVRESQAVEMAR